MFCYGVIVNIHKVIEIRAKQENKGIRDYLLDVLKDETIVLDRFNKNTIDYFHNHHPHRLFNGNIKAKDMLDPSYNLTENIFVGEFVEGTQIGVRVCNLEAKLYKIMDIDNINKVLSSYNLDP